MTVVVLDEEDWISSGADEDLRLAIYQRSRRLCRIGRRTTMDGLVARVNGQELFFFSIVGKDVTFEQAEMAAMDVTGLLIKKGMAVKCYRAEKAVAYFALIEVSSSHEKMAWMAKVAEAQRKAGETK